MSYECRRDGFTVTADPARVDLDAVHAFLSGTYWCAGIPRPLLERAIANSICFSLLADIGGEGGEGDDGGNGGAQIGFARVVTDRATYAYLCDVYVLPERRGAGLGSWLMECVMAHPDLQGLRRFGLVTRDAHALYRPLGFMPLGNPDGHMEIAHPGLYLKEH